MAQENQDITDRGIQFSNGTTIEGLGGTGTVSQRIRASSRLRSPNERDTSPQFEAAMADLNITEQETIELDAYDVDGGSSDTIVLRPAAALATGSSQLILYQDESGGISWHFPTEGSAGKSRLRSGSIVESTAGGRAAFVIPLRTRATRDSMQGGMPNRSLRGPITKIGRKIFKVLVLPALSGVLENPVQWVYQKVESRNNPYCLWKITPDNYKEKPADSFTDWQKLTEGPTLLLVHGIFSSVEGTLSGLPKETMQSWCDRYDGRVIAFNHPTVSASPEENARWFLETVANGAGGKALTFDIICHSRGGIVSRVLSERPESVANVGERLRFRSVYFVAAPNAGSPLGDADHMMDMLDLFTTFMSSFPDGAVTYSLNIVLALVMVVARAGVKGLPGIAAMSPAGGYIETVLNANQRECNAIYGAAAADYKPVPGRDNGLLLDKFGSPLMGRIFEKDGNAVGNDLVVPQLGVYSANRVSLFPIKEPLVFGQSDGVWHCSFFAEPRTLAHIEAHLSRVNAGLAEAQSPGAYWSTERGSLRAPVGGAGGGVGSGRKTGVGDRGAGSDTDPLRVGGRRRLRRGSAELPGESADRGSPLDHLRGSGNAPGTSVEGSDELIFVPEELPQSSSFELPSQTPPVAAKQTVSRDPNVSFADRLEAGESAILTVQLKTPDARVDVSGRLVLPIGSAEHIALDVELSAPGFSIDGQSNAQLIIKRVNPDPSAEKAVFLLTALDLGAAAAVQRVVKASFWIGNDCVGGVTHSTIVVPKGSAVKATVGASSKSAISISTQRRESPDLIISMRQTTIGQDVFELSLRSRIPQEEYESRVFGTFSLDGKELGQYLSDALDSVFKKFPPDELSDSEFERVLPAWNATFLRALEDLGNALWLQLPSPFREEYLRLALKDALPKSIGVYSDELQFPWEIVRPSGLVGRHYRQFPPLGTNHVLGRWQPATAARPQPQARPTRAMAILCPRGSKLGSATGEAAALQSLIPGSKSLNPVDRQTVDTLLQSSDVQLVHFSGHGAVAANADLTELELDDGPINAARFATNPLGAAAQPVLFLNACTVGRGGKVLGRSGGFAGLCIEAGWSGVVAPYWPVYDPSAAAFALKFYQKMKSGRCVGEAMQELRAENPTDPTAQSYAYFGDPFSRMLFQ